MAKIRDLPLGDYPAGSVAFGPRATPNGLDGFEVRIGRCTTATPTLWTDPATVITIDMQFSFDGGATYTPIGENRFEDNGGIKVTRDGELAESRVDFSPKIVINGVLVKPTHLKGRISVNTPVRTYVDVTIVD